MVRQFFAFGVRQHSRHVPLKEEARIVPVWRPVFINLMGWIALCLALLVVSIVMVARAEPVPQILELPDHYLPGNLPPEGMSCDGQATSGLRCAVEFEGHEVHFDFDTGTITRVIIPAEKHTLGQLIASWGMPTGINWNYYTVYVYWPTRWAILGNETFRPASPVKSILYTPDQPPSSPWRGFRYEGPKELQSDV